MNLVPRLVLAFPGGHPRQLAEQEHDSGKLMGLERRKAILTRPRGKATETPDQQNAIAHPNACRPARVPVKVTIRDASGRAETCRARTLLINRRGVRFESLPPARQPDKEHYFQPNEILWIEVPSTGKATAGRVVWVDKHRNRYGNFEFAVELEEPQDIFDAPSNSPSNRGMATGPSPSHNNQSLDPDAARARPREPHGTRGGTMHTTDRLAEVLQEVVESAVRKEEEAASERLVREVKTQMGQTRQEASETLRREMTEQAAGLESQLLQECRARTEQLLSATLETALRGLSEQMDEMAAKTEERVRKVFDGLAAQLEQRTAKALAETNSRIEEQVERATKDIHDQIAQKVLMELTEKQKVMVGQMQQQIGMVTEQNLIRLRGGLTRTLQELAEASQNGAFVA
jgi:hypothetical protein